MSSWIDSAYHLAGIGAGLWLILLWLHFRVTGKSAGLGVKLATGGATAGLLLLPLGGSTVGTWIQSFHPNPSVPGFCLIGAALYHRLFGGVLLKGADLRALLLFGTVVGSVLYLHTLWPNASDLYYWGWLDQAAIWTMAAVAVAYLLAGNRMGVLILLSLMAYTLRALESENAWDYVIDPVTWLVCMALQLMWLFRATWKGLGAVRRALRGATGRQGPGYGAVAPTLVEGATRGAISPRR
ncbi:MAG: hypothetical protein JNJ82_13585 [Opitutaceae bacterium]|nr:hypothetical protein [Opitutaceae bacterium]